MLMNQIVNILVLTIALLHFYFLVLEMFLWTKPKGLKIFNQSLEKAQASKTLAANQGLYNGFLASGLIWSLFISDADHARSVKVFFLLYIFIAGLYGAKTVSRKIFFVQALPALLCLCMIAII